MRWWPACAAVILLPLLAPSLAAQLPGTDARAGPPLFPEQAFLVTGYGTVAYTARFLEDRTPSDFAASLSPILLFQISDNVLFEAEMEMELEESTTHVDLEYADIGYALTENLTIEAGKFLLPFNVFSERLHPTWINKSVTPPAIYGHHGGAGPTPLLPILSDVGVQLRSSFDVGQFGYVTAVAYVTQGPALEMEGMEEDEEGAADSEVPEVAFGSNFEDNNTNKMIGARVGVGIAPAVEVNISVMTAKYDPDSRLRFTGLGAHLEGRYRQLELHSEWIRTSQEVPDSATSAIHTMTRNGYFTQLAFTRDKWEALVRWSQTLDGTLEDETIVPAARQLTLGLDYWLKPALVLKLAWRINIESGDDIANNALSVQWAFGF